MKFDPADLTACVASFAVCPTSGFRAYSRDRLLEAQPPEERAEYAEAADAWVAGHGGRRFQEPRAVSKQVGAGRVVAKHPGPHHQMYELPPDAVPRG